VVRNGVLTSAAAVALAAAVLSMPGDLVQRLWAPVSVPLAEGAAMFAPSVVGPVALPNGIVLQTVDTADGTRAEVAALPAGVDTDLRVGDVLLVYAATGEMIESAEAVQALVEKEMSGGITTMGFAVQRDGKMAVGYIGLTDLDEAGLENRDQVLEKKT
jgi:hypothetical protein